MNNSNGFALALALSMVALIGVIGIGAMQYAGSQAEYTSISTNNTQAFWLAEAGIQASVNSYNQQNCMSYTTVSSTCPSGCAYCAVPANSKNPFKVSGVLTSNTGNFEAFLDQSFRTITSKGTALHQKRTIEAKYDLMGYSGFLGINGVNISGSGMTDSYNSNNGTYNPVHVTYDLANGNVATISGDINLTGSAAINGSALPGTGYHIKNPSQVNGNISGYSNLPIPPVVDLTVAKNSNNDLNLSISSYVFSSGGTCGYYFNINGGNSVTLPAGTYCFDSFNVSGSATVNVNGPVKIYVSGDFYVSGGSIVNISNKPLNLQIFSNGSNVALSGSTDTYAVVYAPSANFIISGSGDFIGAVTASNINNSSGAGMHYDEALGLSSGSSNIKITSWKELAPTP